MVTKRNTNKCRNKVRNTGDQEQCLTNDTNQTTTQTTSFFNEVLRGACYEYACHELQPTNVSQHPSDGRLFHIIGADKQKLCGP